MPRAVDTEVMNLRVQSLPHLAGVARKIDRHPAWGYGIDRETLRLQPQRDRVHILLRCAVRLAKLFGSHPFMEAWRFGIVQLVDELLYGLLLRGGPLQLQLHMFHRKLVRNAPKSFCPLASGRVLPERV